MILSQKYHQNNLKLDIPSQQDDITATMQQDAQLHPLAGFASIVFGYTRSTGANLTPPNIVWKLIEDLQQPVGGNIQKEGRRR